MKRIVMVLFLLFNISQANETEKTNIWSIGLSTGSYGYGPYWRIYSDNSYYQVNGFLDYERERIKATGEVIAEGMATVGVSHGYYLYKSKRQPFYVFPNNVNFKSGGNVLVTEDTEEYVAAIGIGFEFKYPDNLGFNYEISVDYVGSYENDNYSERIYLGPSTSIQFGFNF